MAQLCATVGDFAGVFLLIAALAAFIETGLLIVAKTRALQQQPTKPLAGEASMGDLAKVLEALKNLLLALKDLPAWIAIFLAALALVWTATSAPGLCKPERAPAQLDRSAGS
jgi:hypothetical protein